MKKLMARWSLVLGLVLTLGVAGCTNGGGGTGEDDTTVDAGGDATLCTEDAACDDENPCTKDKCTDGACVWTPAENTCDDGDPCTENDMCVEGECAGAMKACDDGVYCNGAEACNPVTGTCEDGVAPEIDDDVPCTLDECDEEDDKVVHVPNDALCDDGNTCTANVCDETLGCLDTILDGEACEDGSLCTEDDTCDGDTCIGEPVVCDDGEFCNGLETCDPENGDCADGEAPELDDGLDCTVDACDEDADAVTHTPDDGLCDDENTCTVDSCDVEQGCLYDTLEDGEDCDDGNECTDDDVCGGGVCMPGKFVCVEDCANELDDDQDELVDCADDDCALDMACQPGGDLCGEAFDLTLGMPLTAADAGAVIQFFGTTIGKTNVFSGACDDDTAAAADTVHKVELAEAMGLQISADFDGGAWAALYILNDACTEDLVCETMDSSDPTTLTVVLQPGTYFITVDGAYPGDVGTYDLEVEVFLPAVAETDCGDGVDNDADGLVDCDDDECLEADVCNILTGETCGDALLLTEAPLTVAAAGTEIVVTGTTVGMLDDVTGSCVAQLLNTPDLIYSFELVDPLVVDASFDFSGNKWPALALFAGDCMAESELVCTTAKSEAATFSQALPAGTYYVVLDASYNNDAGPFTLTVSFAAVPETEVDCTNGIDDDLNGAVDCDDEACGEDPLCVGFDGDNCAKPYLVNDGEAITAALYGQTLTYQGTTDGLQDFYGACSPAAEGSPDAVYMMEVTDPVVVHATHDFDGSFWPSLYAMDAACDAELLLGCDTATSGAAELDLALPAGTYFFVIDASYIGDAGPFTFELTFAAPPATEAVCYDTTDNDVDGHTDCADDDCAADLYCMDMFEPNDTQETAYDLGDLSNGLFDTSDATVSPAAMDVDHFKFSLQGPHDVSLTLTPSGGLDGKVTILDGAGMTLLSADTGGINVAETIDAELAGGTYYIWISGYGITKGSYSLTVGSTALTEYDCGNGEDEDGDGLVDCCDDDCAAMAACGFEDICVDGEDNDCDGLSDCDDDDCMGTAACGAGDTCEDALLVNDGVGIDATYDGATLEYWGTTIGYANDFSGTCDADTEVSPDAVWELVVTETVAVNVGMDYMSYYWPAVYITSGPCGEGEELACATATSGFAWTGDVVLEPGTYYIVVDASYANDEQVYQLVIDVTAVYETEVDCGDGVDNDFDGLVDCCDDECVGAEGCLEVCGDELDNDCDGMTDCCDDECAGAEGCLEICGDGMDNDCDELADCCDDDCSADAACATEVLCDDGMDNDCDGSWDCGDADCGLVPECEGEGCAAAIALNDGNPIKEANDGLQLVVTGDTSTAQNDHAGSCDADTGAAKDLVYTFEIAEAIGVAINHDFDSSGLWPSVYLFGGDCMMESELACAATTSEAAVIHPMLLQPGTYFVVVDASYSSDAGPFTLTLDFALPELTESDCHDGIDNDLNELTDCADPACAADEGCMGEVCATAFALNEGAPITAADAGLQLVAEGDTDLATADLAGSCDADSAAAADHVYTFTLDETMGVQISHDFDANNWPMVYVFAGACVADNEVACGLMNGSAPAVLPYMAYEPGTYFVVVDSSYSTDSGPYTLTLDFIAVSATEADCGDGADNDLDGMIDCCDDDCTGDAACDMESLCGDGVDNDCDELFDCDDPDCAADMACMGETCDTAIPLDEGIGWGEADDGLVVVANGDTTNNLNDFDFDCDGDGTQGKDLAYTFTLTETMGVELTYDFTNSGEWEQFFLGTDCTDLGVLACAHTTGAPATIPMMELAPGTYFVIADGDDSMDDGPFTLTVTLTKIATTETDCTDGIDNELDGFVDCCDDECAADAACLAETMCGDGADNDCDGVADCADADCAGDLACEGEACASAFMLNGGVAVVEGDLPVTFNETGDTSGAGADVDGSCDSDTLAAKDQVYELVLDTAASVTITYDFDSSSLWPAVYVFGGECILDNELACSAATSSAAVIEALALDAGTYYIVADASWSSDAGTYTLDILVEAAITVEDNCQDGEDNDVDGFADCEDDDCAVLDVCAPNALPWSTDFTVTPINGATWGSTESCGWAIENEAGNDFAQFGFGVGCSELEPYWLVSPILDVQGCGEITVTFNEAADYSSWAFSHQLGLFAGFDLADSTELALDTLTADWAASGPYTFDVSALDFVRVGAGYMGDDADTWRVDDFLVECTVAAEICDDGEDNNGDELVDCDDPECADFIGCLGDNCAAPIPLAMAPLSLLDVGLQVVLIGDTTDATSEYEGSCDSDTASSPEHVFAFELTESLYVSVSHDFDGTYYWAAAYLFSGTCEAANELACDVGNSGAAEFGLTLEPGTYYIIADASYSGDAGPYTLTVDFLAPPPADEIGFCDDGEDNDMDGVMDCADEDCALDAACAGNTCDNPLALHTGGIGLVDAGLEIVVTGDTSDFGNSYAGSCSSASGSAKDVAYVFELTETMAVAGSYDFDGTSNWSAAYLFAAMCGEGFELGCDTGNGGASELSGVLPAGSYYVIVDANWSSDAGPYTLTMTFTAPPPADEVGLCTDGLDNDLDELTDCLDVDDCAADPGCGDDDEDGVPNHMDVCDLGSDTVDADEDDVPDACQVTWAGQVWPNSGTEVDDADAIDVYVQVYMAGVTDAAADAPGAGIEVNLVYQSASDMDATTVAMIYNSDQGNNDEFMATIPADATIADEAMAVSFEVYYVSGETMYMYTGAIEDQANATPISYAITGGSTPAPYLIFFEYVEGGSNNKAVELLNVGDAAVDLQGCAIDRYTNGAAEGDQYEVFVSPAEETILAPDGLWVVCHSSIVDATDCDYLTSSLNHNGDDALAIRCGEVVYDIFGKIGEQPAAGFWANGDESVTTKDMTLRRSCGITGADTDGTDDFDPGLEWTAHAKDDLSDLGSNHCEN